MKYLFTHFRSERKMTVVTKPLTAAEKKKEAEANSSPLVQVCGLSTTYLNCLQICVNFKPQQDVAVPVPTQGKDEPDLRLTYLNGRVRRMSRANHLCLALCLTLVTMLGLMAAMHIYKTLFIRRSATNTFFKWLSPLFYLSGISVEVTGSLWTMESCRKTHWLPQTSR